jgi:hypothetical protein
LLTSTLRYEAGRPLTASLFVLAKHPFTRAWSVDKYEVKGRAELAQHSGLSRSDDRLCRSPLLDVLGEDLCPRAYELVAYKYTPLGKEIKEEGTLASWSGTKV